MKKSIFGLIFLVGLLAFGFANANPSNSSPPVNGTEFVVSCENTCDIQVNDVVNFGRETINIVACNSPACFTQIEPLGDVPQENTVCGLF